MKRVLLIAGMLSMVFTSVYAKKNVVNIQSEKDFTATVESLKKQLLKKEFTIFNIIEHDKGAASVGMTLRPSTLIIFGNPKGGTLLMQESLSIGLDLPLKYLVWKDDAGVVWITFINIRGLARMHGISGKHPVIQKLEQTLPVIAKTAAMKSPE